MPRSKKLDAFTQAYIEAALWSSTDNSDEQGGEPLDANYSASDIEPETMAKMIADCADFQARFGNLIDDDQPKNSEYSPSELAGHDFWLSRNGHGAGFFDGDWPKHGDELQEAAESYGMFDLQVDDGVISGYASGGATFEESRPVANETVSEAGGTPQFTRRQSATDALVDHVFLGDEVVGYTKGPVARDRSGNGTKYLWHLTPSRRGGSGESRTRDSALKSLILAYKKAEKLRSGVGETKKRRK